MRLVLRVIGIKVLFQYYTQTMRRWLEQSYGYPAYIQVQLMYLQANFVIFLCL